MKADGIGLYIHIPFCVKKCNYCDFCSFPEQNKRQIEDYVEAVLLEMLEYKGLGYRVDSVFFGGGTPSLLSGESFLKLMNGVKDAFLLLEDAEITLEANPKTLSEEKLDWYIQGGVNRISLGLQSIHENELKILGRIHNYGEFLDTFRLCRARGIKNINVDLMYGLPEQSLESFEETLDNVMALSPEHLSVYGLILEEATPLYESRHKLCFPDEDTEYEMYLLADKKLSASGYSHYEISNYAREGYRSRHNLKYWKCKEYIGLGLSAHSYLDGIRFCNNGKLEEYLSDDREHLTLERLDGKARALERIMLGLRISDGISLIDYERDFGISLDILYKDKISKLSDLGYIEITAGNLSLTREGFYVSNYIINELTEST